MSATGSETSSAKPATEEASSVGMSTADGGPGAVLTTLNPTLPPTATVEGLPEYEPLTPEMVEDESIRGDFVIKWAAILLAVLFGCTLIVESPVLTRIKTGQYLQSHGFLPPAKDVFTYTATGHAWTNLSWLFDLCLSLVYGIAGFYSVSVFKALLAGVAFGFVAHTSRPGLSTWWGSICVALAVLTCQPRFTAQPEIITLLGVGLSLWILHRWLWNNSGNEIWLLVPVSILWSNLDDRAWWGPVLLLLYGSGEFLGCRVGMPAISSGTRRQVLWQVIGVCLIGLMVNPFLWQAWLAPFQQFQSLYPALRSYSPARLGGWAQYSPLSVRDAWIWQPVPTISGAVLFAFSIVTVILNRKRVDFGHVLVLIGSAIPALLATHELAAASIVFCVIATLNGQAWYAATFPLLYSTETRALLISRGGRAITVLGLFTIALLFSMGRISPAGTGAVGVGLDSELKGQIESFQTVLKESVDDRPFNFVLEQGDLLIWIDQKPFIDNRLGIFATSVPDDLITLHKKLRVALSPGRAGAKATPADFEFWKKEFDRFKVTHVLPRLGGLTPDYSTFSHLLISGNWQLAKLGSATAVFYRRDLASKEIIDFLTKNQFDFGRSAFKTEVDLLLPRDGWVQLPTFYERYLWKANERPGPDVREGQHLVSLANAIGIDGIGLALQAIRKAQEGLSRNRNDAAGYMVLGQAYMMLMNLESMNNPQSEIARTRYLQAVQNFNLALVARPDDVETRETLFRLYATHNRIDLALREVTAVYQWWDKQTISDPELVNAQIQRLEQAAKEMDRITKVMKDIEKNLPKVDKSEPAEIQTFRKAAYYAQSGLVLKALELLQPADDEVTQGPQQMAMRAELMLESGDVEQAYELAGQLEGLAQQMNFQEWHHPRVMTLLANAEYTVAAQIWTRYATEMERSGVAGVLGSLVPREIGMNGLPWPLSTTEASARYFFQTPALTSNLNLYAALIYLEAGQIKRATDAFKLVLQQMPEHPDRPLIAFYLERLTGKWVDYFPPSERVPIEFADEVSTMK